MRLRENRTLSVLLGAAVLVGAANVAAYSATGGNFLLGKSNKAGRTTVLTNTGSGAPLQLKGKDSAPPLVVSSKKKVARLNSDLLDGKHSTAFEPKITPLVWHTLPVNDGWLAGDSPCGAAPAAWAVQNGIVYLRGAVCDGPADFASPFSLPAAALPVRPGDTANYAFNIVVARGNGLTGGPTIASINLRDGQLNVLSGEFVSFEGVSYPK